jgi:uncharacterized membrane protein
MMVSVTRLAVDAVASNGPWMVWNLSLALVPLALARALFRFPGPRTAAWWLGVAAFVAFLPNAPYVLTDVIHLVDDARYAPSDAVFSFALLPQYAVFFLIGFEAYVGSLLFLGRYLRREQRASWVLPVELTLHGLCAVGILLGRFDRLNTWDAIARPGLLWNGLVGVDPLLVLVAFGAVAGCYAVLKPLTIAVIEYRPGQAGSFGI